jgi:hypothetical protein
VTDRHPTIVRLTGVYHADGGLVGEVRYVVGKLLGRAHCALCDITHGPLRRKAAWDRCVARLDVPVDLVHLNEMDPAVAAVATGRSPCVVGHFDDGTLRVVLDAGALEACRGDVEAFADRLREALRA